MLVKLLLRLQAAGLAASVLMPATPAHALIVYDPTNFGQNVLTAARSLEQINNQIRSLQNEAQSLINQAKNLATIRFPEIAGLTQALSQIDTLMGQARGIQFHVATLNQQFATLFPMSGNPAATLKDQLRAARGRFDTELAAYRQTMTIQAQIVETVQADAGTLTEIVARSQDAQGSLQAAQATNQLLALTAKQQFQIEHLMTAQYRAQALERARNLQARNDAQTATRRFLGTGQAYNAH